MSYTPAQISYFELHASDDKRANIVAASIICYAAAVIAVALRFFSRHLSKAGFGADDWCILLGLLVYLGAILCICLDARYGMGRHVIFITNLYLFAVLTVISECLYTICLMINKLSVLLLYRRVFPQRSFLSVLLLVGFIVIGSGISGFFAELFNCAPIRKQWEPTVPGHCLDFGMVILIKGIINIATDFIILSIPMPILWNLQLDRKTKWNLTGIFLMGGTVCIASIVRVFFVKNIGPTFPDPSWADVNGVLMSIVEIGLGMVSVCLPTYRPFLRWISHGRLASKASEWPGETHEPSHTHIMLESMPSKTQSHRPESSSREEISQSLG